MDAPYFIPFPTERPVLIFHRIRGCGGDQNAVAFSRDPDTAQRIVDLLNADERLRMQAQMKGSPSE